MALINSYGKLPEGKFWELQEVFKQPMIWIYMNDVKGQTCQQPASNFLTHSMCKDALHTSCNKARQTTCHCLLFIKHCMEIRFKEELNRQCKSLKLRISRLVIFIVRFFQCQKTLHEAAELPTPTGLERHWPQILCFHGFLWQHQTSSGWSLDPYDPPINYSSVRFIIQIK